MGSVPVSADPRSRQSGGSQLLPMFCSVGSQQLLMERLEHNSRNAHGTRPVQRAPAPL